MPSFWENFGGLGQALGGFATGFDAGLKPLTTLEALRTSDLANDKSEITNEDLATAQAAKMGRDVPAYYGAQALSGQTGFQQTTAQNQLGADKYTRELAIHQRLSQPDAQQVLSQLDPNSSEYNRAVLGFIGSIDPTLAIQGASTFGKASDTAAANQQIATQYLQSMVSAYKDPVTGEPLGQNVLVTRLPNGQYRATKADGSDVPISSLHLGVAQQYESNPVAMKAIQDRATEAQKLQGTSIDQQIKILNQVREATINDPVFKNITDMLTQARTALTSLGVERTNAIKNTQFDEKTKAETIASIDQRIAQAQASYNMAERQFYSRLQQHGVTIPGRQPVAQTGANSAFMNLLNGGFNGQGVPTVNLGNSATASVNRNTPGATIVAPNLLRSDAYQVDMPPQV